MYLFKKMVKSIFLFGLLFISQMSFATETRLAFANQEVIIENVHSKKVLCTMHYSKDAQSNNNQENIIQYQYTGDPTHKWKFIPVGNGLYKIENVHSRKVLCTMHYSKDAKSNNNQENIIQYQYTGDPTHHWRVTDQGGGQYTIENGHSRKVLCTMHYSKDAQSNNNQENIIQYQYTGDPTHKWNIKVVAPPLPALLPNASIDVSKTYVIQNVNGLAFDIPGASTSSGERVQQYAIHKNVNQQFKFVRVGNGYVIKNVKSGHALDIVGGSKSNGAKLQQYTVHNKENQQFIVSDAGGGYYYIQNVNSRQVLDVPNNANTSGLQIQQWPLNKSNAQKFRLIAIETGPTLLPNANIDVSKTYMIKNANGLVLDVLQASKSSGVKIQQYPMNRSTAQQFRFVRYGNGYIIKNVNSGLALDILGGSKSNGAKLQQYTVNNSGAQQFIVSDAGDGYYYIQNVNSRLVLDVPNNASTSGLQIHQWPLNKSNAQKFRLVTMDKRN